MPGIIGTPPVVSVRGTYSEALESVSDATAKNDPGAVVFGRDTSGRWSMLAYYKAGASIPKGAALGDDTAAREPYQFVISPTANGGLPMCKGFAAADVSNTGYYSWRYIAGYCPDVAMPSTYASDNLMRLSATYAGRLSSAAVNATVAHEATALDFPVAISLGLHTVSTANSTNSAILLGFFM